MSRIASLQCENQSSNRETELLIRCERGAAGEKSTISCLGKVSENAILAAALTGWTSLAFIKGDCTRCPLRHGEALLQKAIDCSRSLLDVLGFREFRVHVRQAERNRPASLPRRALFRKITERLSPAPVMQNPQDPRGVLQARQAPRRTALLNLLRQASASSEAVLRSNPTSPFAQVAIHSERCSACGVCCSVCPAGALTIKSGDDHCRLDFNSGLCLNCSLCSEACPVPGALDWKATVSLNKVAEAKFANAARIALEACVWCGELVRSGEGAVCPICRKRHLLEAESVLAAPPDTETTTVA